ncbi:MAG: hypothetical protein ACRCWO_08660 [Bosea sp. (in: a-proteobacteria)]
MGIGLIAFGAVLTAAVMMIGLAGARSFTVAIIAIFAVVIMTIAGRLSSAGTGLASDGDGDGGGGD